MNMKKLLLLTLLSFIAGWQCGWFYSLRHDTVRDTVVMTDTIVHNQPVVRESLVVRYRTVRLPVDTVYKDTVIRDSVQVVLPVTQKVYEDSIYRAWVSGYNPQLDSIKVFTHTSVVHIRDEKPQNKWHIGISSGIGLTPKGIQPYVGLGITYSLY